MEQLKNGAYVIDRRTSKRGYNYALCKWGTEFVVWCVDSQNHAYWGHYFDNIFDAVEDFKTRPKST